MKSTAFPHVLPPCVKSGTGLWSPLMNRARRQAARRAWEKELERRVIASGVRTYFLLRGDGQVKVGWSRNVDQRKKQLECAAGPLTLLGTVPGNAEPRFRSEFAALRTHGEWFRYEEPLVSQIASEAS
jgi:hypothetical protein